MASFDRQAGGELRNSRRWTFADSVFDERDWTLTVAGQRVAIETKPLELLRLLLLNAGHLVSKSDLMDAAWPDVAVVEASLPTAIRKLRLALGDDERAEHLIETVQKLGYRMVVPVTLEDSAPPPQPLDSTDRPSGRTTKWGAPLLIPAGLITALALFAALLGPSEPVAATKEARVYSNGEAMNALRRLDVAKIDTMIASGWKPDDLDADGNNALNRLLEICEWDPAHDRAKMLLVARALLDGGANYNQHNKWGDTAYSIAKAKRYCGPSHPVTVMLRNLCYAKGKAIGDTCLATYELKQHPVG